MPSELVAILPDLTPTVVSLLILAGGFFLFLRELKEREKAMRDLEREVREKVMTQLEDNTRVLARVLDRVLPNQ